MKKLHNLPLFMVALFFSAISFAQSEQNPNSIKVAGGIHDSYGTYDGDNFPFGIWNDDNLDAAFQLQYTRFLNNYINLGVNVTAADLDNMYDEDFNNTSKLLDTGSSIDLDLFAKYKFNNGVDIKTDALFQPYLYTGVSGTYISDLETVSSRDNGFGMNVPLGIGMRVAFTEKVNLDLSGAFKIGLFDKIPNRWEYMAGLAFNFGPPIVEEVIPEPVVVMPEPKDTDKDGIIDTEDECPNEKGVARLNGCPEPIDTDGDGVIDLEDDCPNERGVARLNGCPEPVDTDGDGIVDDEDDCPTVAGVAELFGCPRPIVVDSDGDGIADKDDACPAVPGIARLNGCPEVVEVEVVEQIQEISKNIFFELSSFDLKPESKTKLDELLSIMKDYSNFHLSIEGHTDSSGPAAFNQTLSEKRAAAVRDYLVSRGAQTTRVTSVGYGENRPIADNSTKAGMAQNRRVDLVLDLIR